MHRAAKKIIIYDLDGTLVDSMPGILMSFRHTLKELNYSEPNDEEVRKAIGPGLHRALQAILGSNEPSLIEKAVKIYREHHDNIGYKATTFYPGITELLLEIKTLGVPQYVASMKSDTIVRPILEYLEFAHVFEDAIGSSPDGNTKTKAEMLRFLAKKHNFLLSDAILIGDTAHDARAAKEADVTFFGVTFGYGTRAELEEVAWGKIFNTVGELTEGLRSEFSSRL